MADLNKKLLADVLCDKFPDLKKKDASAIIDTVFDEIVKTVKEDKKVDITGFGKFVLKTRKARTGINPVTKETITIPESHVPGFRPSKTFKELVK